MTPEQFERVEDLFHRAKGLAAAEQRALLDAECGDDAAVRAEVEKLLAQAIQDETLENSDAYIKSVLRPESDLPDGRPAAPVIEGYQIVREIHRGGQGVVYQALQKSTKRKVAIKLLLEGPYASKSARRRFEREIELVAQLKHPNIIGIFHSGQTADGHQYCVMDYIRGVPLDQYVRDEKLTLEAALELFSTVCEAVTYAHQKGVIHRDLKPSNILVDADGSPRVLDFGLAKQMVSREASLLSISGQVMGTLPYMSPEQAGGNPDKIDIRTDVYALGVILYQMLTGQYPYPVVGQMADVLKHIAETPPTPPSRSWKSDSGVTERTSKKLRPGACPIDDEVQTIVLRTLAKERDRRYQSAGELANDVKHYLANEPIEAKRDSAFYVLKKQLRRYKAPATVAAMLVLLILGWGVTMSVLSEKNRRLADSERQARELADARAETLRRALYRSSIALAQNAYNAGEIGRVKEQLSKCPPDLRGWEWDRLTFISDRSVKTLGGHTESVYSIAFSPDGKRIVSGDSNGTVKVRETTAPSHAMWVARQAEVARLRHLETLKRRLPESRRSGLDAIKKGDIPSPHCRWLWSRWRRVAARTPTPWTRWLWRTS